MHRDLYSLQVSNDSWRFPRYHDSGQKQRQQQMRGKSDDFGTEKERKCVKQWLIISKENSASFAQNLSTKFYFILVRCIKQ
jgi:hypothetical protein